MSKILEPIKNFYNKHPNIFFLIISLFIGFITPLFGSWVTSFIYGLAPTDPYVIDGTMFYELGNMLAKGYKPYYDMFDQKGIYIFYYTALGVLIGGKVGILLVQVVVFTTFYYFMFKIYQLYNFRFSLSLTSVLLISGIFMIASQSPSDFEMLLPLLTAALYFYIKGLLNNNDKSFIIGNIIIGISVGISIHSRLSDAFLPFAMVVWFGVERIKNKKIKSLFINAGIVISMIVISSIPAIIHAYLGGFIEIMYQSSLIANFTYIGGVHSGFNIYKFVSRTIIGILFIGYGLALYFFRKKYINGEVLFYSIILGVVLFLQFLIAYYPHYLLICIPFFIIFATRIISLFNLNKLARYSLSGVTVTTLLFPIIFNPIYYYSSIYKKGEAIRNYINLTISSEHREFNTYCYDLSPAVYLNSNITPRYAAFAFQYNFTSISKEYTLENLENYILSDSCYYLITPNQINENDIDFSRWLDEQVNVNNIFTLVNSNHVGNNYINIYVKTLLI